MRKKKKNKRPTEEVNASSMADIAFLLLIFFLVTTTIVNEKGISFIMPKKQEEVIDNVKIAPKNLLTVLLNSNNLLLVGGEIMNVNDIKRKTKRFINNRGADKTLSDSPEKAIISFKADRGSQFKIYLNVLDELKASYNELRAEYLNISVNEYLSLDPTDAEDNSLLKQSKTAYPPTLSEAEPTDFKK